MNALTLFPAKVRFWLYIVYGTTSLTVGSVAVYFASTSHSVPSWVVGATAVLVSLGAPFGALASSNVTKPTADILGKAAPVVPPSLYMPDAAPVDPAATPAP